MKEHFKWVLKQKPFCDFTSVLHLKKQTYESSALLRTNIARHTHFELCSTCFVWASCSMCQLNTRRLIWHTLSISQCASTLWLMLRKLFSSVLPFPPAHRHSFTDCLLKP